MLRKIVEEKAELSLTLWKSKSKSWSFRLRSHQLLVWKRRARGSQIQSSGLVGGISARSACTLSAPKAPSPHAKSLKASLFAHDLSSLSTFNLPETISLALSSTIVVRKN